VIVKNECQWWGQFVIERILKQFFFSGHNGGKGKPDREAWEELKTLDDAKGAKGGQAKVAPEQDGNYHENEGEQFNQGEGDTDKQQENVGPWDGRIGNRKADAGNEARTFLRTNWKDDV